MAAAAAVELPCSSNGGSRSSSSVPTAGPMQLQLASDIHLERSPPDVCFGRFIVPDPEAQVLVLAGDIGCPLAPVYYSFLGYCSRAFKHVILVAGNHEYSRCAPHLSMQGVDQLLQAMCAYLRNCHYLGYGANFVLRDVNFLGATMYTPVGLAEQGFDPGFLQEKEAAWGAQLVSPRGPAWSIAANNSRHHEHLDAIAAKLNWGFENRKRNVVITHHSPLLQGPFEKSDLPSDFLYGTDLSKTMDRQYIQAWNLWSHPLELQRICQRGAPCQQPAWRGSSRQRQCSASGLVAGLHSLGVVRSSRVLAATSSMGLQWGLLRHTGLALVDARCPLSGSLQRKLSSCWYSLRVHIH